MDKTDAGNVQQDGQRPAEDQAAAGATAAGASVPIIVFEAEGEVLKNYDRLTSGGPTITVSRKHVAVSKDDTKVIDIRRAA